MPATFSPPKTNGAAYTPQKMRESYERIAQLKAAGAKDVDIAAALNYSPAMVRYVTKFPLVVERIHDLQQCMADQLIDLQLEVAKASPAALSIVLEMMITGSKEDIRLKAAERILDMNPQTFKGAKQVIDDNRMTPERLANIKDEALERARKMGIVQVEDAVVVSDYEEESK